MYKDKTKKTTIRTSLRRLITAGACGYLLIMFLITLLTSAEEGNVFSSRQLHTWSSQVQKELLVSVFQYENHYFGHSSGTDIEVESVPGMLFELVTRLNFHEPRTLLGKEIPGLALFDGNIIVAGEGTDFTNMPIESAPPMEVLMEERQASADRLEIMETPEETKDTNADREVVAHIVHSHSRESFYPELEEGAESAFHPDVNITMVGQKLGEELEERGIGTIVNKTDVEKQLDEKGWDFTDSYKVSRTVLQEAMENNNQLELFFDLHRDSQPRDVTTVTTNGETMARTIFVIGENNPHYEKNLEMATALNDKLDEKYPGLSRGVITKGGGGVNGRYNQDLSEQSVLIEIGGMENNLDEAYQTAEALAEVINEWYNESTE
ncbi:stage II sporulation protein P [Salibacterium aidingense]|uniref:stage II sporulation protein P n=1 Tax=Salibacterium aidingense TaxID=384933 RepID=UPI0004256031|nr:stage II sporulation protein P [Salibacterium aidingense]